MVEPNRVRQWFNRPIRSVFTSFTLMTQISRQKQSTPAENAVAHCPSVGALEYELAFLVRRLEAVRRKYDYGLERAHYLLLLLLVELDGQSVGSLAEQVNLDASTVTRQIAAMVDSQLVEKHPNPDDRRGGFVTITEQGREAVEQTRQRRLARVGSSFSCWGEAERVEFARLMARFNRDLSQSLNDPEA